MKRILTIMICAMFTFSFASAQDAKKKSNVAKTTFLVESISCENCIKKIEKNIAFEKGVTDLKCDLEKKIVEVTYRSDRTTDEKLMDAFKKIDKPAKVIKKEENL